MLKLFIEKFAVIEPHRPRASAPRHHAQGQSQGHSTGGGHPSGGGQRPGGQKFGTRSFGPRRRR